MFMFSSSSNVPEYFTYPGKLERYKWFKPILTGVITFVLFWVFGMIAGAIGALVVAFSGGDIDAFAKSLTGGYDTMEVYSAPGAIVSLGGVAALALALLLANLITRERPFKSFVSSRNGWNMKFFGRALLIACVISGGSQVVLAAIDGGFSHINVQFTVAGFILFALLVPFQCIGEELVFRGLLGQTLSTWLKNPILGILVSTAIFALCHPYNIVGKIEIFFVGTIFCLLAYYTKGLEASSALHIANNAFSMFLCGIGATTMSSEVGIDSLVEAAVIDTVFLACIIIFDKKTLFTKSS